MLTALSFNCHFITVLYINGHGSDLAPCCGLGVCLKAFLTTCEGALTRFPCEHWMLLPGSSLFTL